MINTLFLAFFFISINLFCQQDDGKAIVPSKRLIAAVWKVASRISSNPIKYQYVFDKSFIENVGEEKLTENFKKLYEEVGGIIDVSTVSFNTRFNGDFFFHSEKGYIIPVSITINDKGKVISLFFKPHFKKTRSVDDIVEDFKSLRYSKKGLLIKKLTEIEDNLYSYNDTNIFAVGPAFQLYILAYLTSEKTRWDKVLTVKNSLKSTPLSTITKYANDAPATVYTLAHHMISENDNTAADILIDFIGRKKLENFTKQLTPNWRLNLPFLKTAEAIKLKIFSELGEKYSKASEKEREDILSDIENKKIELSKINLSTPIFVNTIGWFFSPQDICRVLDYIRIGKNPFVNTILETNHGLDTKTAGYLWAGFKGGNDNGILTMNWLLQAKDNRYYCISIMINDENKNINQDEVISIIQELLNVFATE